MGGRNAEVGWFRTKTDVFHNDVAVLDREQSVQWRAPTVAGDPPAPREFHSLTSLPDGRMLLFGGLWRPNSCSAILLMDLPSEAIGNRLSAEDLLFVNGYHEGLQVAMER